MKKSILILLICALLFTCCACDADEPSQPKPASPDIVASPSQAGAVFDPADVDELTPVDGVYQIVSLKGLENIAAHPDAQFALLCDIDLKGAKWTPIGTQDAPFTGELDGGYFTVSNFTIDQPSSDGSIGFFAANDGTVKNLLLSEMTIASTAEAKNIGSIAGSNTGTILRCTTSGAMTVSEAAKSAACGGGIGSSTGEIRNCVFNVDIDYSAAGDADVGGLVGRMEGGSLQFSEGSGRLKVTGKKDKAIGLISGTAKAAKIKSAMFLGEANTVDGLLLTDFLGKGKDVNLTDCRYRDNSAEPLSDNVMKLRERVVQAMYDMGTVEWTVSQPLYHSCTCSLAVCHGVFQVGVPHIGMPYTHKGGSLARFRYCLDENGVVKDWLYDLEKFDGFDMYMGNDCSTAIQNAWATIGNSFNFKGCYYQLPYLNMGCIPVGDWEWNRPPADSRHYTQVYMTTTGEERMYEAYAKLRKGDSVVHIVAEGGHTRMVAEDAVVVRDENGRIDPNNSYVITHEQGGVTVQVEPYHTSWGINCRYTFSALWEEDSVPVTIQELVDGTYDEPKAELKDGAEGRMGLVTGNVTANYFLDSVSMEITDESGKAVFSKIMFTTVGKTKDANSNDTLIRSVNMEYDLAHFAVPLRETQFDAASSYHCVITANLATGDSIVVKDYTF